MLKNDLIKETAKESGVHKTTVRAVLDAASEVTHRAIAAGDTVMLMGLGRLKVSARGEKKARNIHTGATVVVPPRNAVILAVSDSLAEAANAPAKV